MRRGRRPDPGERIATEPLDHACQPPSGDGHQGMGSRQRPRRERDRRSGRRDRQACGCHLDAGIRFEEARSERAGAARRTGPRLPSGWPSPAVRPPARPPASADAERASSGAIRLPDRPANPMSDGRRPDVQPPVRRKTRPSGVCHPQRGWGAGQCFHRPSGEISRRKSDRRAGDARSTRVPVHAACARHAGGPDAADQEQRFTAPQRPQPVDQRQCLQREPAAGRHGLQGAIEEPRRDHAHQVRRSLVDDRLPRRRTARPATATITVHSESRVWLVSFAQRQTMASSRAVVVEPARPAPWRSVTPARSSRPSRECRT